MNSIKKKIPNIKERVFSMSFKDSENDDVFIGDNQSLRSDIELPTLNAILELKSSNNVTKEEHIWQLRNYLDQRKDMKWGIVINFISKFTRNSQPYVQCDIIFPFNKEVFQQEISEVYSENYSDIQIDHSCYEEVTTNVPITKIWRETFNSNSYPNEDKIVFNYDDYIKIKI